MIRHWIQKNQTVVFIVLMGLIIGYSGFIRLFHLGHQSLWIDEAFTIQAARGVQKQGTPILSSGIAYTAHPLSIYITAFSQEIFGFNPMNPWSSRLPHTLFSIASIGLFAFIVYRITKNMWVTLLITFIFSFFDWHIAWSRQTRGYTMMQFFLLFSYLFAYYGIMTQKIKYFFTSILALVAATLSQGIAMVMLPLGIITPIISIISTYTQDKIIPWKKIIVVTISGSIISMLAYHLWVPSLNQSGYHKAYLEFILYIYLPLLIVLSIGIGIALVYRKKIYPFIMTLGWILIPLIIIAWYAPVFQLRYLLVLTPFVFIAVAQVFILIANIKPLFTKRILAATSMLLVILFSITQNHLTPQKTYQLEFGSPQPLFNEAYQVISDQMIQIPHALILSPYPYLSELYLDNKGLWIPISLTGKPQEITERTINGAYEYYTGAPIIHTLEEFTHYINTRQGFIVLDSMSLGRIPHAWIEVLENNPRVKLLFEKSFYADTITIFQFSS